MARFIVFFLADGEILEVGEDEILLGDYQSLTPADWRTMDQQQLNSDSAIEVRAEYNDDWFDAVLLQVVLNPQTDSTPTIQARRKLRREKKKSLKGLLRAIRRVNTGERNKFLPINTQSKSCI